MRRVEGALALLFFLGGLRSLWYWLRRPFEGVDVTDHLLYAAFVTARVGLWFAFGGIFLLYATMDVQGRAALDELERHAWIALVPIVLAAIQLGAAWFLGRREAGTEAAPRGGEASSGEDATRRP